MQNKTLIQMIGSLAEYYQIEIKNELAATYVIALEEYQADWDKVYIHFVRSQDKFPTVNQIVNFINPQTKNTLTTRQQAVNVIDEILYMIKKFGWTNEKLAYESMGPMSKLVIERLGGWQRVCKADTTNTSFMAQARDVAEAAVVLDDLQLKIQQSFAVLPGDRKGGLTSAQEVINKLGVGRDKI